MELPRWFNARIVGLFIAFLSLLAPLGIHLVDRGSTSQQLWLLYPLGAAGVAIGLLLWTQAAIRDFGPRALTVAGFAALAGIVLFANSIHSMFDDGYIPVPAYLALLLALALIGALTLAFVTDLVVASSLDAAERGEKAPGTAWKFVGLAAAWALSFWPGLSGAFDALADSVFK